MLKRIGHYVGKAAPAAIALVLVAGFAHATVPDSSGMIHGCYAKTGGALRVINTDVGQHCTAKQTALGWEAGPNVVARLRWSGSEDVQGHDTAQVTLGSWTQRANEIDTIDPGTATLTFASGVCQSSVSLNLDVAVSGFNYGNGSPVVFSYPVATNVGLGVAFPNTVQIPIGIPTGNPPYDLQWPQPKLFEPSADTQRTLTVSLNGNYAEQCPSAGVQLTSLSFDVEAIR